MAGIVWLMGALVAWLDEDDTSSFRYPVGPTRLGEFFACHRWADPVSVTELGQDLTFFCAMYAKRWTV